MTAAEVQRRWDEHSTVRFPPRLRDDQVAEVDVALLDADIAGCVTTWLSGAGRLHPSQRQLLQQCLRDADRVLVELTDAAEVAYVQRLRSLAAAMLTADN